MEKPLSSKDLKILKENNLISEDEIAIYVGETVVAENIISKERRILEVKNLMLECKKRLLNG